MLFDVYHTCYIIISSIVTVGLLLLFSRVRSPNGKALILKSTGIATVVIHVSSVWVEFLILGHAEAYANILFPIFFCNLAMYMLLISGLIRNKEGLAFRWISTFAAYAGTIGALISLFYPDYYLAQPDFWDWGIFKSFISHSVMMIGSLYLFVGGYVKIRVFNLIPYSAGLIFTLFVGLAVNGLFAACGLEMPNAMFLLGSPIEEIPFFNGYGIGLLMICLILLFTVTWEFFAVPKGERWYNRLKDFFARRARNDAGRT